MGGGVIETCGLILNRLLLVACAYARERENVRGGGNGGRELKGQWD